MDLKITRHPVDSSAIREIGHGLGTLEVQFHAAGCDKKGDRSKSCSCAGGEVHQIVATPEEYAALCRAKSIGSHFVANFRSRKSQKVNEIREK